MSINQASISGNLVRDSELRSTASGLSVLTFTVAVNDRRKGQSGQWEDYPNYIECTVFGKRAESLAGRLGKGQKVLVAGKLNQSRWEKDGQKHSKISITANEVETLKTTPSNQQQSFDQPQTFEQYSDLPF